jgi:hypothetical protein
VSLSEILVQNADTDSEWSSITLLATDKPFTVNNGQLQLAQAAFVEESENTDGTNNNITRSDFSDGSGNRHIAGTGISEEVTIDLAYDVSNLKIALRCEVTDKKDYELFVVNDGVGGSFLTDFGVSDPLEWNFESLGSFNAGQHTIELKLNDSLVGTASTIDTDVIAIYDGDFTYTFDNTVGTNGYLSGPELFPSGAQATLDLATSRRNISEGTFNSTWKDSDVSGAQAIEIAPDGSTFQAFNNTTSGSFSFANPTQEITTRFTFDRYGSRTTATPTSGFKGQAINLWELTVNPDTPSPDDIGTTNARAIVPPNTSGITGNTVREAGLKSGSTLLTRHQLAEFVLQTDQRLASSETNRFKGTE